MGAQAGIREVVDNVIRQRKWRKEHPGDVIRPSKPVNCAEEWYECLRNGEQIAEANTLGMLLDRLESDFR